MPNVRRCIKGCITFKTAFKFAKFGPKRQQWLNLLNVKEPHQRYLYACEHHFSESVYSLKRPMKNAMPNQNLDKCFCNPPIKKKKKNKRRKNKEKSREDPLKLDKYDSNTTSSMDVDDEDDANSDASDVSLTCSSVLPPEEEDEKQEKKAVPSSKPITRRVTAAAEILVTDDNKTKKSAQKELMRNPAKSKDIETQLKATLVVDAANETHKKLPVRRPPTKTPLFTGSYSKLLTSKISLPYDTDGQKIYPKLPVRKQQQLVTATPTNEPKPKSMPMMVAVYSFGEDTEFDMENYVKFPFQKLTKQHTEIIMPTTTVPKAQKSDQATTSKSKKCTITRKPTRYAALNSTPKPAEVLERPINPLNTKTRTTRRTPKKVVVADLNKKHQKLDVRKTSTLNHDHSYTVNEILATAGMATNNTDTNNINENIEIINSNPEDEVITCDMSTNFVALSERGVQTDVYTFANSREYQQLLYIIAGLNKKVTAKEVEIKLNVIKQHVLTKELDHLRHQYSLLENEIRKKQQIINKYKLKEEKHKQVETTRLQHEQQILNEDLNPMLVTQNDSTEV